MRRTKLATRLAVAVLAGLGLLWGPLQAVALAETSVNGANNADGSRASSGDATGSQTAGSTQAGPQSIDDSSGDIIHDGENSSDVSQDGRATAGSANAGGQTTAITASGKVTVQMANDAEDSEAEVGDATVTNTIGELSARPIVGSCSGTLADSIDDADACIVHEGDNELSVSQSAAAGTGDAVAGSQVLGAFGSDVAAWLSNESDDADATGGEASAFNELPLVVHGPTIGDATTDELSTSITGPVTADIVHEGDNEYEADQSAWATTGDALAGAQVAGGGGGDFAVEATNDSEDATAESGNATSENTIPGAEVGPRPSVAGGFPVTESSISGAIAAQLVHEGDNDLSIDQEAGSATGDAVAGGQLFGVVAARDVSIVAANSSEDAEATSGEALATNTVDQVFVGPEADALDIGDGFDVASIDVEYLEAQIVHEGDNDLELGQSAEGVSGDAVAGGAVYGVLASGDVEVEGSNESEDAEATSGDTTATNDVGDAFVGPEADACEVGGGQPTCEAGTLDASIELGDATVQIVHEGDNDLELDQSAGAASGDAVAGGQVAGLMGRTVAGIFANDSEDAEATTGTSDATNSVDRAFVGPEADLCEAEGGGTDECALLTLTDASIEIGDGLGAQIVHEGDNDLAIAQSAGAGSGDAVAGSQVVGILGDNLLVMDNASDDAEATSGGSTAGNTVNDALAGPEADVCGLSATGASRLECEIRTLSDVPAVESISGGEDLIAQIVHEGDNDLALDQDARSTSGDAVAGGQVAGVISVGPVDVEMRNHSEDGDAETGDSTATNDVGDAFAGPEADFCTSDAPLAACAIGTLSDAGPASVDLGDGVSTAIAHDGDNDLELDQGADAATGDAVGGGQVLGVIATDDVYASMANSSEDDSATTGDATAANVIDNALVGPDAQVCDVDSPSGGCVLDTLADFTASIDVGDGSAVAIAHDGENDLSIGQSADAASGDATAGQMVTGIVTDGDGFVRASNDAEDAEATSGDGTASNALGTAAAGPRVELCDAGDCALDAASIEIPAGSFVPVAHDGDNDLEIDQSAAGSSGDAAAGGMVVGIVAGGDAGTDLANVSEDAESRSGDGTATNDVGTARVGPETSAIGVTLPGSASIGPDVEGSILHDGDNELGLDQSADASTGDSVAGSQVSGLIAGGAIDASASNRSEDADSRSGDATAVDTLGTAVVGPVVISFAGGGAQTALDAAVAFILHPGDNELDISQSFTAHVGDALSGAQVGGMRAKGDVDVTADNESEDASSDGGDATGRSDILSSQVGPIVDVVLAP